MERAYISVIQKAFDPDQPRDETGKWTAGGGSGGSSGRPVTAGGGGSDFRPKPADVAQQQSTSAEELNRLYKEVIDKFPPEYKAKLDETRARISSGTATKDLHFNKETGQYTPERQAVHNKIVGDYIEKLDQARPINGEKPEVVVFGGRGGSGKSQLSDGSVEGTFTPVRDANGNKIEGLVEQDGQKYVVLDGDAIKGMLPEYQGWNAAHLHEEGDDIFEDLVDIAREMGANLVLDVTLKSGASAEKRLKSFIDKGFRAQGHYMQLPREKAAARAVGRYAAIPKNETEPSWKGRFVPPEVVLTNVNNEANFENLKKYFRKWSWHNNDVEKDQKPILVGRKGYDK